MTAAMVPAPDASGAASNETWPLVLRLGPLAEKTTEDDFFEFCRLNRDLRIERTSYGELVIMPPSGGESGNQESRLVGLLFAWAEADGTGEVFSPSTGFLLPNGAQRSPDVAWVSGSRWDALTPQQRKGFPPLCPDFVAEIRSPSDALSSLQAKMQEYMENGARLGWLIDPVDKKAYIYRPGAEVECLTDPETLCGDPVLPGFELHVRQLWSSSRGRSP